MSDETLASKAGDLIGIARAGCRRLGPSVVSEATLERLDKGVSAATSVT
jgi:hypothetical protein